VLEGAGERALELTAERAAERAGERVLERTAERAAERAGKSMGWAVVALWNN
jgi:hypothetical protein